MPQTPHIERHFTASEVVRDVVIGMSDGLTVPFALAAGLTGAISSTRIIVTAGLAENLEQRTAVDLVRAEPRRNLRGGGDEERVDGDTAALQDLRRVHVP